MSDISSAPTTRKITSSDISSAIDHIHRAASEDHSQPPQLPDTIVSQTKQLLFQSFPQLANPNIDQQILTEVLKKLEADLFQGQLAGENETIHTDQDRVQDRIKQNQKKLKDMLHKMKKQKTMSLAGKIFGWIAAGVGILIGAILAVVSFGTGSAIAGTLIAMSVALAVTIIVLEETGTMDKIVDKMAGPICNMLESFGMDHKKAMMVAKMTSQVILAVTVIAVQLTLAIASGGTSSANVADEAMSMAAKIASKAANFAMKATAASLAATSAAKAGVDVAQGVYESEALKDQADMKDNQAILKKIQTLIESEQDIIKEIIDRLTGVQTKMGQMIKDENENRGILADINTQPSSV